MKRDTITIVGAGMAGLLCANLLRVPPGTKIKIIEAQPSLPNNHSAVLRFRTSKIADALGNVAFSRVNLIKDVLPWRNPVADALAYSRKNSGVAQSDRSIVAGRVVGERFIAPSDFIARLEQGAIARGATIEFGKYWQHQPGQGSVISTLPMPALMKMLGYGERVPFYSSAALTVRAKVRQCNAYVTLMFPDPFIAYSRASITGDELIVEVPRFNFDAGGWPMAQTVAEEIAEKAIQHFGFERDDLSDISAHKQPYAKILPMDDTVRKHFIYSASHNHEVFSLGRFATWRPGLLLDDLVKDIELINNWVVANDRYSMARAR